MADASPSSGFDTALPWYDVLVAATFIVVAASISFSLGLKLESQLIVASIRCVVQLTLMGLLLEDVFRINNMWLVLFVTMVFIFLGSYEIVYNRTRHTFRGIVSRVLLVFSTMLIGLLGIVLALRITPFWTPTKFIPIVGMLLGNSMASVTMATDVCLGQVNQHAPMLDTYLAMGASRFEATRPLAVETIRMALLPIIAQTSVMGLVNIPGTMVGLLLSGADVHDSVIYQQALMFMIVASCTLGSILSVVVCDKKKKEEERVAHNSHPFFFFLFSRHM
ncbi:UPF0014 family [Gongronella butleri]|nr:UPF0014 family [Gongronella butleri]